MVACGGSAGVARQRDAAEAGPQTPKDIISFWGAMSLCGREEVHGPPPTLCSELLTSRGQGGDMINGDMTGRLGSC